MELRERGHVLGGERREVAGTECAGPEDSVLLTSGGWGHTGAGGSQEHEGTEGIGCQRQRLGQGIAAKE